MRQSEVVLEALKKAPMTSMEAFVEFGITRLAARIDELRKSGHRIHTAGLVQQQIEMLGHALPVGGQFFGGGAVGQRAEQGVEQATVLLGFEPALGFEGIAQAHQFVDAGDDAGLLGQRGYRNQLIDYG